ncbi:MAG: hypothetical protein JWO92_5 [Chitinophagaceae bacterium]|nr:hypothetical protein [Chitinophagaceae bacterium]
MIVKSLSRKSDNGSQLVNYIFRYIMKPEKGKDIRAQHTVTRQKSKLIIRHNIRARSIKGFCKEFRENESYRLVKRRDCVKLFHTIIAFSNKDREKINDDLLKDIAGKFISLRGTNNLYCGTSHLNTNSIHLHIIVSGTQLNGRSSRMSKQQFRSLKTKLQEYQKEKYPGLSNSIVAHNRGTHLSQEVLIKAVIADRHTNKETLIKNIEAVYSNSISKENFLVNLNGFGYSTYTRNNKLQGIKIGNSKYRFSRFGLPDSRLKALDQIKDKERLIALHELRNSQSKEAKRDISESNIEKENIKVDNELEQKELDDLDEIRSNADEKDKEKEDEDERNVEPDDEDLDDNDENDDDRNEL